MLTYTFTVSAQCASITNYKIIDTLAENVTWVSGGDYNAIKRTVTFLIPSIPANSSQTFTLKTIINTGTYFATSTLYSETVQNAFVPLSLVVNPLSGIKWEASPVFSSAPYSLKSAGAEAESEQTLTSLISNAISGHVELSFRNNYNTEASRDGGVVELSTDEGSTWFDAGPYMIQNGYNATILAATSLDNRGAFSGKSNGFIQTKINLSSFGGKTIKFRFRFVTDKSTASVGWYIDDILITKAAAAFNSASLFNQQNLLQNFSDTVTAITADVLPLVWGNFIVLKTGNSVSIKWSTLQELNTDKFLVERSLDGINFLQIATVLAAGNSNRESIYEMNDPLPSSGLNYYRIAQVDRGGNITYSDIRSLLFDKNSKAIIISPNPAKDKVMIKLIGNKELMQIDLLSTSGQKLATYSVNQESNKIDLPVLAPGVYYIKVTGALITGIKKLIIE